MSSASSSSSAIPWASGTGSGPGASSEPGSNVRRITDGRYRSQFSGQRHGASGARSSAQ